MNIDKNSQQTLATKPLWHGVILVAGGAVGAGMFALPLVSAGAWFSWATLGLVLVCVFTYLAAKLLIEVNIRYPAGSSFDTLIRSTLGDVWASINNVSVAFIMFILMYAYITAGAGILGESIISALGDGVTLRRPILSCIFAVAIALFIWFGTSMVSRVSTLLMIGMCASFAAANSSLLVLIDVPILIAGTTGGVAYIWSALPVFVTAFACGGLVPSLSTHYDNQSKKIGMCIFLGLALALLVYFIWLASTLGNISRQGFIDVADNGGGLSALVMTLQNRTDSSLISVSLTWFSHFAVITSFLSVALGLAHFLADRFNLKATSMGRAQSVGLAFLPPLIASIMAPYGFVSAIAYAGVFVAFSFFIVPALMVRRLALGDPTLRSRSWILVFAFGGVIVALKLLSILALLPLYP